jgi:hypothetical protein
LTPTYDEDVVFVSFPVSKIFFGSQEIRMEYLSDHDTFFIIKISTCRLKSEEYFFGDLSEESIGVSGDRIGLMDIEWYHEQPRGYPDCESSGSSF